MWVRYFPVAAVSYCSFIFFRLLFSHSCSIGLKRRKVVLDLEHFILVFLELYHELCQNALLMFAFVCVCVCIFCFLRIEKKNLSRKENWTENITSHIKADSDDYQYIYCCLINLLIMK